MKISIIDGNNWFRRRAETSIRGNVLRECFYELQNSVYDLVFLVWDGKYALNARRKIYPEYKLTRNKPGENFYEIQNTFKQLAELSKAHTIQVDGYEGDDVIAHIVQKYKPLGYSMFIESNDGDLCQLGCTMARLEHKVPAGEIALYKTLVGDPSDNIKGIPGFGVKAWESCTPAQKAKMKEIITNPAEGTVTWVREQVHPKFDDFLSVRGNGIKLRVLWDVVNFLPMEAELVNKNFKFGQNRPDIAEITLKQFMS